MGGLRRILAGYGFLIASVNLAAAAEPIKLRVADSFPKGHYLVRLVLEPWMAEVQKRTNNAVTFEHYPAQQLGKAADMLKLTQTGVADIGTIVLGVVLGAVLMAYPVVMLRLRSLPYFRQTQRDATH